MLFRGDQKHSFGYIFTGVLLAEGRPVPVRMGTALSFRND